MNLPGRNSKGASPDIAVEHVSASPEIGAQVVVAGSNGSRARGVIVDDFGDLAGTSVGIGTERVARARRWAVDIDGGHVVFVDTDEILEVYPAAPQG